MKKKTSLYEYSLWRLFWQSGLTGMIIWAFAELAIVFVCIYKGFHMKEHSILLLFMWVFGLVVLYPSHNFPVSGISAAGSDWNTVERPNRF